MSDETSNVESTEPVAESTEPVATDAEVTEVVATQPAPVVPTPPATTAPAAAAASVLTEERANARKVREGVVVSDKMQSTVVVAVRDRVRHPRFRKTVLRTKKLYAHDERNEAKIGDVVRIVETRPISKLKRWRLAEIVERAR
jgi:small subunit ribosomal protein S17